MDEDTIVIPPEDVEVIDASEYKEELSEHFEQVPEVAKPLLKEAKNAFSKIEKALYTARHSLTQLRPQYRMLRYKLC